METPRQIKTKAYYIAKLSILMTAILIQSVYFNSSVLAQCYPYSYKYPYEIYCHYANSYPDRGQPHWGNHNWSANGIANDSRNWYFATHNRDFIGDTKATDFALYRVPVAYDINNFNLNQPGVKKFQLSNNLSASDTLRRYGYGHVGDIDYCQHNGVGYIAAPMTGNGPPLIAFFRADDLSYIHYAILDTRQQESVGWCAFSGDDYLYTSHDDTDRILRYTIKWDTILNKWSEWGIAFDTSFVLKRNNNPIVNIRHMQGGDFTPSGELLYISCGILSCLGKGESDPQDGIYVFETESWNQVFRSSNSKMYPESVDVFDFKFNNNTCSADEPEGLTIWDVDHLQTKRHDKLHGHLHIILDNHNKYQIIRNIFTTGKWVNPAYYIYKPITRIVSFFKRSKVHTSKVSVQHFGPYKYDSDEDGGGWLAEQDKLTEQDKIDIALLESAFMFLQKGDTLGMVKYLAENLDERGYPVQQTPQTNPEGGEVGPEKPTKPTTCWYNRSTLLSKSTNGYYQFQYCEVQSPPNCGKCIQNSKRNFGISVPSSYLLTGNLLLSYIDIAEMKNNDFNTEDKLIPFFFRNSIQTWMTSDRDETAEYSFKFIVPGKTHAWLATTSGKRPIHGLDSWLFQSTGSDEMDEKRKSFLYRIAVIAAQDPDFEIIERPTPTNLRAVIAGNYNGRYPYLIGINDDFDYYTPVNLTGDVEASRRLIQLLRNGNRFSEPLSSIIKEWYQTGKERTVVACVEGGRPGKYRNPKEVWRSGVQEFSGHYSNQLTYILSDGTIIGYNLPEIKVDWYQNVASLANAYLAMLAIVDPETKILDIAGRKVALVSGDPDSMYLLNIPKGGGEPIVVDFFAKLEPDKKRAYAKKIKEDRLWYEENWRQDVLNFQFD